MFENQLFAPALKGVIDFGCAELIPINRDTLPLMISRANGVLRNSYFLK